MSQRPAKRKPSSRSRFPPAGLSPSAPKSLPFVYRKAWSGHRIDGAVHDRPRRATHRSAVPKPLSFSNTSGFAHLFVGGHRSPLQNLTAIEVELCEFPGPITAGIELLDQVLIRIPYPFDLLPLQAESFRDNRIRSIFS